MSVLEYAFLQSRESGLGLGFLCCLAVAQTWRENALAEPGCPAYVIGSQVGRSFRKVRVPPLFPFLPPPSADGTRASPSCLLSLVPGPALDWPIYYLHIFTCLSYCCRYVQAAALACHWSEGMA